MGSYVTAHDATVTFCWLLLIGKRYSTYVSYSNWFIHYNTLILSNGFMNSWCNQSWTQWPPYPSSKPKISLVLSWIPISTLKLFLKYSFLIKPWNPGSSPLLHFCFWLTLLKKSRKKVNFLQTHQVYWSPWRQILGRHEVKFLITALGSLNVITTDTWKDMQQLSQVA